MLIVTLITFLISSKIRIRCSTRLDLQAFHNSMCLLSSILRVMGISCNIIKPKEVAKLHPLVNIHDLVGALHLPADAVVSPPEVNHALAVAAAGQGNSKLLTLALDFS